MKYKIDFGKTFMLSVLIILFSRVWTTLGSFPEAFAYGSVVYQCLDIILFVLCNLSIGVAAAIIFYYVQRYAEKKKDFKLYTELRRILLVLLYKHLELLSKIEEFEAINQRDKHKQRILGFDTYDIPKLMSSYNKINSKEQREKFKNNLAKYFKSMSQEQLQNFSNSFQKEINEMKSKEEIRYFKDSDELIDTVFILYTTEFSICIDIYVKNRKELNEFQITEEPLVSDYIQFLDSTIELYKELQKFIDSIERKKIKVFIKMLN